MTRREILPPGGGRVAALRWGLAGAVALGLHVAVAVWLIRGAGATPVVAGGGDAIAVELEPVEGDVVRPDGAEPAVPTDAAETADDAAAAAAGPPAVQPVQPVAPPQPPPAATPPLPPPPPLPSVVSDVPPLETPAVPPPQPSAASSPSVAAVAAAPVVRKLSAARDAAWRGRLVPHLNRFRRFPAGLGSGTARIGFTLDGEGRVTAVSVVTGSGHAALDDAACALVWRASPFPPPPPGTTGDALRFVVPVHYDARHP